jgi:hypothetical protein
VVTTPNSEYNINFPNLRCGTDKSDFRHDDHRFEWTRSEFETWCTQGANEYGYQVQFHGIGRMKTPIVQQDVGCCTQACVFIKTSAAARSKAPIIKKTPHELFRHIAFPWYNSPDKEEHEIIQELDEIILKLSTISCTSHDYLPQAPSEWCETWSWDQLSENPSVIPTETEQLITVHLRNDLTVEELWSVPRVRQLCRTRGRLRELLSRTEQSNFDDENIGL